MNKLEKLLDEILTDIGCDCNIKLELIDAFDTETREYYDVLNNRVQNGETIAKVELDILRKKIYDRISNCKIVFYAKFTDGLSHPVVSGYTFDYANLKRKVNQVRSLPDIVLDDKSQN